LKFYDTQGFEVFKTEQNTDIRNLINSYENYLKINDKVHIVFLILKDDRLEGLLDFIKFIMEKNISIFLIANKFQEEDYDIQRNNFNNEIEDCKQLLNMQKNYLKNHLYFVDLISEKCDEISTIIKDISIEFSESKKAHDKIIMKFESAQKEKDESYKEAAPPAENEILLKKNDDKKD
jgi:predicted secreted acid phosphatase